MNLAEMLLEISKRDLAAAKRLYDNELYPQAIFYLQQSVEKAAKAFGLQAKIITEKELKGKKGIGHNPLKIHKKIADEQLKQIKVLRVWLETLPELKKTELVKSISIGGMHEALERFMKFYKAITNEKQVSVSKDEVEEIIEELKDLETKIQELNENFQAFSASEDMISKVRRNLTEFLCALFNSSEKIQKTEQVLEQALNPKFLENILKKLFLLLLEIMYIHFSLFYFSILTFPHSVVARYPEDESNPLEIYTEEHPLVQLFGECCEVMDKTLKRIEEVMKHLDEPNLINEMD